MSDEWPDEAYDAAAWTVGLACLELLSDEGRWVHRRVETIDLLRRELVRRQVTVEFTLPEPLHDDLRIGEHGPWCVPIAILRKERLRHFDLREDGKPLPILGADQNGPIATALLEAAVMLASDPPGTLRSDVAERLGRLAAETSDAAVVAIAELLEIGDKSHEVHGILEDATASFFLATLAESYLLIALLPHPPGRRILKYSYDQDLDLQFGQLSGRERLIQRMGWAPMLIDIAVPVATRTPSYHAEVVIPEELRLDAFIFDAVTGNRLSTTTEDAVDRASLHAPRVPADAEPVLLAAVYAERSGTPTVALGVAAVTSALLLVGATVGNLDSPLAGSSVAVLLAGSALFAATVARGGEHRLVRDVFAGTRRLLTAVGLSAIAAASTVAFGASASLQDFIWLAGGAVSLTASAFLGVAWKRASPLMRNQIPSDTGDTLIT